MVCSEMRDLKNNEQKEVMGGLDPDAGALAIIGLGFVGGPFTAAFGLTIGLGILLRSV